MTIRNPSFETEDPGRPGSAAEWTLESVGRLERGEFGHADGIPAVVEDFDGWNADTGVITVPVVENGLFDVLLSAEDFETGWDDDIHPPTNLTLEDGLFDGGDGEEDFESGWGDDAMPEENLTLEDGLFTGSADVESFESGWGDDAMPEENLTLENGKVGTSASLNTAEVEDFEGIVSPEPVYVDPLLDEITTMDVNGLEVGDRVEFENVGGRLPDGLQAGVPYYILDTVDTESFTVVPQPGGTIAVDIQDYGLGENYYIRDRRRYWITRGQL